MIQAVMILIIWTVPCENGSLGICGQRKPRPACTSTQSDQGVHSPLTESLDTIECINAEHMLLRDFTHAQDEYESVHFVHA